MAVAHGDSESMDSMKMGMGMAHGSNTTQPPKNNDYPDTYFAHTEHSGVIYTHIALMVLSWVFILPVGKFHISPLPPYLDASTYMHSQPSCFHWHVLALHYLHNLYS